MADFRYSIQWNIGAGWVTFPGVLGAPSISLEMAEGQSGLGWGVLAIPSATVRADASTEAAAWHMQRARVHVSTNGGTTWDDLVAGPLVRRADDGIGYAYTIGGWGDYIHLQAVHLPLRTRRPVATPTSSGTDDPDVLSSVGLLNEIWWRCGGRPIEAITTYPSATFYYSCHGTSTTIPYAAIDGDDLWGECQALAEAAGGQIYQDSAGTLRFVNPLFLAEPGASPLTLGNSDYGSLTTDEDARGAVTTVIAPFERRILVDDPAVFDDTTPRLVRAGATEEIVCRIADGGTAYGTPKVTASLADLSGAAPTLTTTVTSTSAMRVVLSVENTGTVDALVDRVTFGGQRLQVVGQGEERVGGTGTVAGTLSLPSNRYIQSPRAARRWATQAQRFYGTARPPYTATSLDYDARLRPGAYVVAGNDRRDLDGAGFRVTRVRLSRSGARVDEVGLIRVDDLPKASDFFCIDETYADEDVRSYGF